MTKLALISPMLRPTTRLDGVAVDSLRYNFKVLRIVTIYFVRSLARIRTHLMSILRET